MILVLAFLSIFFSIGHSILPPEQFAPEDLNIQRRQDVSQDSNMPFAGALRNY